MNKDEVTIQDAASDFYEEIRYKKPYSWLYQSWWFKKMIELVKPPTGGLILDDGCGTGHLAEFLPLEKIIGLDISEGMLKYARKRIPQVIKSDAQNLPFQDETFDCVFARALLHHLPEPEKAVAEIKRVLKKGGRVIFCDTLCSFLSALPRKIFKKTEHFSEEHKNLREKEIINMIKPHLIIKKIYYFGYLAYPLLGFPDILDIFKYFPFKIFLAKILIKIDEAISKMPFLNKQAWGIMIVAEKQ